MRCDRISLMHAGVVLACDTPKALVAARGTDGLEEAFIGYIADAAGEASKGDQTAAEPVQAETLAPSTPQGEHPRRAVPLQARPAPRLQPARDAGDPARPGAARLRVRRLVGPDAGVRVRDHDRRREHPLRGPGPRPDAGEPGLPRRVRGFAVVPPPAAAPTASGKMEQRLRANDISLAIEMPTEFGRDFKRDASPGGLRRGRRRQPVPRRDDQAIRHQRESAFRHPEPQRLARRQVVAAPRRDPVALPLQPELRERLRDRAEYPADPPDPDPGHPHGGERRAGEGARLDHQLLRDAHHAARVPAGQAAPLHRDRDDQLSSS